MAAKVTAYTLIIYGEKNPPFIRETAQALKKAIPNAQLRMLEDQTHDVQPEVLAPVLTEFFSITHIINFKGFQSNLVKTKKQK